MITTTRLISLACITTALSFACSPGSDGTPRDQGGDGDGDSSGDGDIPIGDGDGDLFGDGDGDLIVDMQPPTANCGDGVLDDDEACDDGNMMSLDGCGSNCRYVEPGWVCPEAGEPCRAYAKCGDGIPVFPEQCDDGNLDNIDGCSVNCKIEIGFKCDSTGGPSACSPAVCGNGGEPEGAETCDDGNNLPFDGCSERCQGEPLCTESGCTSTCGDGLIIGDEECDDGNAIDDDGCSSTCQEEPGYVCTQAPPCPDGQDDCPIQLPIVFRDFTVAHSDFHAPDPPGTENRPCDGYAPGIASAVLNENGKPNFVAAPPNACVSNFPEWYVDSDVSSTILGSVTLYPNGSGGYVNRFGDMGEPYLTAAKTDDEQSAGATLAACETSCAQRARDAQPPFQGMGHLRCNDLCQPLQLEAQQLRDVTLVQLQNQLMQEENSADPDPDVIAELEEDIADTEAQIEEVEEEAATCVSDCQEELEARTAECAAQCAPCSFDAAAYCIGGELLELDGDPLFFPIDGHPDAQNDGQYAARIPAQIYMGLGWPWEDGACGLEDTCNTTLTHNFHFTSEIAYWFEYQEGMEADLTFVGDDDVWVYVNRQLVLDLGGIHVPLGGEFTIGAGGAVNTRTWQAYDPGVEDSEEVTLDTGMMTVADLGLEPGNVYEIKVFHAERKPEGSSFQLTLSGFNTARSECVPICGDGILAAGEQCDNGEENNTGGYNGCSMDCQLGSYCGDGIVQTEEGEQCDDADPNAPGDCAGCRQIVVK